MEPRTITSTHLTTENFYFFPVLPPQCMNTEIIINPLVPEGRNIYRIAKISFFKKEGFREKNSYERRVYELVDDESLSKTISQNLTGKMFQALMG